MSARIASENFVISWKNFFYLKVVVCCWIELAEDGHQ